MYFLPLILLLITGCGSKNKTAKESAPAQQTTPVPAKKVTVSGIVMQTSSYCGGAAPPDFIIKELETPRPLAGKKLHIIKGDTNIANRPIVLSFISDSAGKFSFRVEPGLYSVLLEEQIPLPDAKKYSTKNQSIDEACYKKWWAKPYYLLEVEDSSNKSTSLEGLVFLFHKRCFINSDVPCLSYLGPFPP